MPKFNGYEKILEKEASKQYKSVTAIFYDETDFFSLRKLSFFEKSILFIISFLVAGNPHENSFFIKIRDFILSFHAFPKFEKWVLNQINTKLVYDNLVVVKGYGLSENAIQSINAKCKSLYQWDNIIHFPSTISLSKVFDVVYSFDKADAQSMRWKFLPNFYLSSKSKKDEINLKSNDLFFVGVYSPLRLRILADLIVWANVNGYSYYFKLYSKFLQEDEIITNKKICKEKYNDIFRRSKFIIEISKCEQIGYSQRYLESLDNGSVFVVANSSELNVSKGHIISLSEFKSNNIVQNNFLLSSFLTLDESKVLEVCEVSNWLKLLTCNSDSIYFSM